MPLEDRVSRCKGPWWNKVANGEYVLPPPPEKLDDIPRMMGATADQVASIVAEEWYGVRHEGLSDRVRRLAPCLDQLSDADVELVEKLANRLARNEEDSTAETAA